MFYILHAMLQELWLPYLVVFVLCYLYIKYSSVNFFITREKTLTRKNVLFVIAHPDDECMFFAPSILSLLEQDHNVFVVCMSKGDYEGQGETRKKELKSSCSKLGVPSSNVTLFDDERLKDGPDNVWDVDVLAGFIRSVSLRVNAQCVVTFDDGGVSGHPNHIALYTAIQQIHKSGKLPDTVLYTLETTNLFRKYTSVFDLPFSSIFCLPTFVNSPKQVAQAWRAMLAHQSQLVWFRKLYITFSRYMFVNTLQKV